MRTMPVILAGVENVPVVPRVLYKGHIKPAADGGWSGRQRRLSGSPFFYFCPRASIAASTFGGDIGSSVNRRPVARSIALAMAAIGGQMLTSAAPLAPYG